MNALVRYGNDKRYLWINVQATGNYVATAMSIMRGGKLEADSVKLKRDRLDTSSPRTVLDISQLIDIVSLHDLSPDQPIQLTRFCQAWWIKAEQRVNVIASDDGFSVSAEGQALNNAAVTRNVRMRMISGQVVSGIVDIDENIFINPQAVKDYPSLADKQAAHDKSVLDEK